MEYTERVAVGADKEVPDPSQLNPLVKSHIVQDQLEETADDQRQRVLEPYVSR